MCIDIPLMATPVELSVNVGGGLLPALLSIWLIFKADETFERVRGVMAAVLVAASVSLGSRYLPYEPENMFLDPKLIYGVSAGLIAYLAGRSRRSAFIGGVLGIVLSDLVHMVTIIRLGIPGKTAIGAAGAFDVIMIAGVVAVMVAELVGETREKLQGGPILGSHRPEGLYEFSKELSHNNQKKMKESKENEIPSDHKEQRGRGDTNE